MSLYTIKRFYPVFILSQAALVTFLVLFFLRSLDDNRLFSWQWLFADGQAYKIFFLLIPAIFSGYILSRASFFDRRPRTFLFFFSCLACMIFWGEPELIMDASRYFTEAKHLEIYGIGHFIREWGRDIPVWTDLPLVPFLYGLIFKFAGENRIFIQAFTTLLFSMTLVLTYLIGKMLWTEEIGFFAAMLLLGMPSLLLQVPLMLVDIPTMFFFTLAVYAFLKVLEQGGAARIMVASLALFLLIFSKYSAWIMLSVLLVAGAVYSAREPRPVLRRSVAVLSLSGLLVCTVVLFKADVISEQIRLLLTYQKPGLERWGESFISTFFFQVHPFITIAAICSFFVAFKKRDAKYLIICLLLILGLAFNVRRSRYLLPAFPMLALMAAYAMQKIERRDLRKFIVFVVVACSLTVSTFAYLPFADTISAANLKKAGEYLKSGSVTEAEVFTLPLKDPIVNPSVSVPLLDLFTRQQIRYQYHPEFFPRPGNIETRSLRFSWEYKNPGYYSDENAVPGRSSAIVVISGEQVGILPEYLRQRIKGFQLAKMFSAVSDPFRYKTVVTIYTKE